MEFGTLQRNTRHQVEGEASHEEGNRNHRSFEWLWPSVRQCPREGRPHCLRHDAGYRRPQRAASCGREKVCARHPIELNVSSEKSIEAAIRQIVADEGRLDVLMHNAGHMVFGPAEAFMPEQLAELYDINVLSTQRVNRAALPQMRKQRQGLLIWVSSSSSAGGAPPYLAPYFASKGGMDAMAVQYARELALWGIETSIIVPGAFTGGTNHFAHSGTPADKERAAEYEAGPYKGYGKKIQEAFAAIVPPH